MPAGEEVGDAYVSIHANTNPLEREIKGASKKVGKDLKGMTQEVNFLDDAMDDLNKPDKNSRFDQLKKSMGGARTEGKLFRKESASWMSGKFGKAIDGVGAALEDKFDKSVRNAQLRTLEMRDDTKDLSSELLRMAAAADKAGDSDFADRLRGRLTRLSDTVKQYDDDVKNMSKDTAEWHTRVQKLNRSIQGFTTATKKDNEALNEKLRAWEEVNKAEQTSVKIGNQHSKTLGKNNRLIKRQSKEVGFLTKTYRSLTAPIRKVGKSMGGSWRRMDGTVRLVIGLIATAGTAVAGLGSAMSGAFIALAAAAGLALIALSPLIAVLIPLGYGFALLTKSFTDPKTGQPTLKKVAQWAPEAASSLSNLGDVIKKIDASALFEHWNDSLSEFADTLADSLEFDQFAAGIGDAFSAVTDSLTNVLKSPVWDEFMVAMEGPATEALTNFGKAFEPLLTGFLEFVTAAAPFAVILSEMFLEWAEGAEKAFGESVKSGEFAAFMTTAIDALDSVLALFGAIGDVIGTVFAAAAPTGIALLDIITGLVEQFNTWLNSAEGQTAMTTFFAQVIPVMEAVFDVLGSLGTALADLVTPEVIDDLIQLLGGIADILPIFGDLIALFAEAHVLDILTEGIKALGKFLEPLIPPLGEFLSILGEVLIGALEAIGPSLATLGEAFGTIFEALTPLLPILGDLFVAAIETLVPLIVELFEAFAPLAEQLLPLLVPLFESLVPALGQIIGAIILVVEAILPFIATMAESLAPMLPTIVDLIAALAGIIGDILVHALDILMPILELFVPMMASIEPILDILLPLVELLGTLLDVFFTVIDAILDPLLDFIENTDIMTNGLEDLSDHIDVAIGWIEDITDAIRDWLENDLGKWATDAGQTIEDTFNGIVEWFEGIGEDIGAVFTGIGDAIESTFKGAFNGISNAWNNTVGSLSWSVPSWVPGIGGNKISAPQMPTWYAAGGIATSPTIAGFGEAGAEALVPLNRPLSQVDPSVRALSAFAQGKGGPSISEGAIVINTKSTDGRVIAESVLDRIVAYSR